MPLLRSNLTCFYCGTKSNLKRDPRIREFACRECEAVNYLDENGHITDPPVSETAAPVRFAHPLPARSASPILNLHPSDQTIFCATCIKNQHLLTQTLAAYLPPPSDPSYDAYEKSYPEYRRNLERRYPQVCVHCAPRVQERISQAGYAAKTDHLRRLMDRTKRADFRKQPAAVPWQSWVLFWAGIAWRVSVATHLVWSAAGAMVSFKAWDPKDRTPLQSYYTCGVQARKHGEVEPLCVSTFNPEMQLALVLALGSFWWNSKLSAKFNGAIGRLRGLGDHMKLQVLVLLVRGVSWWVLRDPAETKLTQPMYRALHLFVASFLLVTSVVSWRVVQIDRNPRINFTEKPKPLLEEPLDDDTPAGPYSHPQPPQNFNYQPAYQPPFPIDSLAQGSPQRPSPPSPSPSFTTTYTAVTTAATTRPYDPRYDDEDTMEWTPTKQTQTTLFDFKPRRQPSHAQQQATAMLSGAEQQQASPFFGRLPPAPSSQIHSSLLRNPLKQPGQPVVNRTPLAKNMFGKMLGKPRSKFGGMNDDATTVVTGAEDDDDDDYDDDDGAASVATMQQQQQRRRKGELPLAGPTLRIKEDPVDTGLEAMFTSVFSIGDEPAEVRGRTNANANGGGGGGGRGLFGLPSAGAGVREGMGDAHGAAEGWGMWRVVLTLPFALMGVAWAVNGVRAWVVG
ncbi:uncharacterized protein K452DRAFT_286733 [Aplosporella prunicola CBS 121167]|uniref:Ima1 N-terminal domain-containing protein n=1 Tax=Aplosporella prunicola CBS 121167 TaxID=1176127 RepID=A0A6A6BHH9_9PEZI|nr:uncharacterized protein K452DRAFT_286733 [Aplosporella prunicola CBS 121167]KAF2142297.1 hypothetical protein K452DRAFT_286733 [Aplosporella prunicola CBS 121167]